MGMVCSMSTCVVSCQQGLTNCSGSCADLTMDSAHCGDCATKCTSPQTCVASKCMLVCAPPTVACGTMCVDTRFDPDNCAMCGKVCPVVAHGTRGCTMGKCGMGCPMNDVCVAGMCMPAALPDGSMDGPATD
jgi:hypothetical protein